MPLNTQVLLASRPSPSGWPDESTFRIVETPLPTPADGEILVRNTWLSLDPYMRGRMDDARSYARPMQVGDVIVGGTVGEVVHSLHPDFAAGDLVVAQLGWQTFATSRGAGVRKLTQPLLPPQAYLGVAGMPGVTAYVGLLDLGQPVSGETVVVSAASGAVGSVVGQIARLRGCRAVGLAGGPAKCEYVTRELGFDACVDYKDPGLADALREATPKGIDVLFENAGGPAFDLALRRLNPFARVPLCGLVAQYNDKPYPVTSLISVLKSRARMIGFIISDHLERWPEAITHLEAWVAEGKIRYRETIAEGLHEAPRAFIGMLRGENLGKQLVKL